MKPLILNQFKAFLFLGFFMMSSMIFGQQKSGKVILIGIDAMSTDGFQTASIPNMMNLVENGAISMKTRGVMPTVSSPNWETILSGAGPEQTGVTKNGWTIKNNTIKPAVTDKDGYFPSIFALIREQKPKAKTAMFYDWKELRDLINTRYISKLEFSDKMEKSFSSAIKYIGTEKPEFAFIYIGHPDNIGHDYGHGTKDYYNSIRSVDDQIGRLVNSLKSAGIYDQYTFLVVTDHGGVKYGHGGESMAEIELPWIISGPGIIKNRMIDQPNDLVNTSPTIAYIMGLKIPDAWIGKPVLGAFENNELSRTNTRVFIPKPVSSVKSGLYSQDQVLILSSSVEGVDIRYTLSGKGPDIKSPKYNEPITLNKTITVRAKSFRGGFESDETTIKFKKISGIREVVLETKPGTKYSGEGPLSLVDGETGTADFHDPAWLGFEGKNLEAIIDFGQDKKISKLALSCLLKESDWIFLPVKVEFYRSEDGKDFTFLTQGMEKTMKAANTEGTHQFSADFKEIRTRYIKVIGYNTGVCPPGHPAKGEKAWLFVDEIIIK